MKRQRGAALLVILMIAGLLGAFFAMRLLGGASAERDRVTASTLALAQVREALIGFAISNGRLPCPAIATQNAATNPLTVGLEPSPVLAAGCANLAGALPWATLGISETDSWGNRFSYRVTKQFTRTVPQASFLPGTCTPVPLPPNAAFALCSQGDMTVLSTGGGTTLANTVPVMVISHGKNGNGAYNTKGNQLPVGADADELENQLTGAGKTTANTIFILKSPTSTFDDIVTWLPLSVLLDRMQKVNKLP